MLFIGQLLIGLGYVLNAMLGFFLWLVVARAILSWVSPDPFNPIVRFINSATDPFLIRLRRYVPILGGTIDLTPIVLIVLIAFVRIVVAQTLMEYGADIKRRAAVEYSEIIPV